MAELAEWEAEMEDGTVHRVVSDQRDQARWEVQDFHHPDRMFLRARFVTWSAMTRQGLTTATWERFSSDCVEVRVPRDAGDAEPGGEGEQGPNPGRRTPGGTPSSTSPSSRASRSGTS